MTATVTADVPDSDSGVDDVDPVSADTDTATDTDTDVSEGSPTGTRRWAMTRTRIAAVVLSVALVAASVLTTVVYLTQYRADQAIDPGVSRAAQTAAETGAVAVLSYAPKTMQRDFDSAESRLTGAFLDYYRTFTSQVVAPAVKEKSVTTTATVVRGAISNLSASSATALVFVNQSVTSTDKPDPTLTSSSVRVGLTKVGDRWLINAFDPV